MIAVRWTLPATNRGTHELAEAIKTWPEYGLPKAPHGWRVYLHSPLGPWGVVIWELVFENLAEYAAWSKEFWAAPRVKEFMDLQNNFTARGGGGEVWTMEQFE